MRGKGGRRKVGDDGGRGGGMGDARDRSKKEGTRKWGHECVREKR